MNEAERKVRGALLRSEFFQASKHVRSERRDCASLRRTARQHSEVRAAAAGGNRRAPVYLAAFWNISASMVMATSSPTTTPPLSMVAFHFTPKSWRLIFVEALMAMR